MILVSKLSEKIGYFLLVTIYKLFFDFYLIKNKATQ